MCFGSGLGAQTHVHFSRWRFQRACHSVQRFLLLPDMFLAWTLSLDCLPGGPGRALKVKYATVFCTSFIMLQAVHPADGTGGAALRQANGGRQGGRRSVRSSAQTGAVRSSLPGLASQALASTPPRGGSRLGASGGAGALLLDRRGGGGGGAGQGRSRGGGDRPTTSQDIQQEQEEARLARDASIARAGGLLLGDQVG